MTTTVHIVNLGPQMVQVDVMDESGSLDVNAKHLSKCLGSGDSCNQSVYKERMIRVTEIPLTIKKEQ